MPEIADINCDLGEHESAHQTSALMQWINSANIACGGHAGTAASMRHCAWEAARCRIHAGAHPGMPDHFGRGCMVLRADELTALLRQQIDTLLPYLDEASLPLHHIKLHGTLYHATDRHEELAWAYVDWVRHNHPRAILFARSGGSTAHWAQQCGVAVWHEVFLDRHYLDDGNLVARESRDALLACAAQLEKRLELFRDKGIILSQSGKELPLRGDTFCLHGDSPHAGAFARIAHRIRKT